MRQNGSHVNGYSVQVDRVIVDCAAGAVVCRGWLEAAHANSGESVLTVIVVNLDRRPALFDLEVGATFVQLLMLRPRLSSSPTLSDPIVCFLNMSRRTQAETSMRTAPFSLSLRALHHKQALSIAVQCSWPALL